MPEAASRQYFDSAPLDWEPEILEATYLMLLKKWAGDYTLATGESHK